MDHTWLGAIPHFFTIFKTSRCVQVVLDESQLDFTWEADEITGISGPNANKRFRSKLSRHRHGLGDFKWLQESKLDSKHYLSCPRTRTCSWTNLCTFSSDPGETAKTEILKFAERRATPPFCRDASKSRSISKHRLESLQLRSFKACEIGLFGGLRDAKHTTMAIQYLPQNFLDTANLAG